MAACDCYNEIDNRKLMIEIMKLYSSYSKLYIYNKSYVIYDFGNPSTPKNPSDNDANPRDANKAALSSITFPL